MRTDGRTGMTEPIVAFRKFPEAFERKAEVGNFMYEYKKKMRVRDAERVSRGQVRMWPNFGSPWTP
jgi:hypothetical protein